MYLKKKKLLKKMSVSFEYIKNRIYREEETNNQTKSPSKRKRFNFALATLPSTRLNARQAEYILEGGTNDVEATPDSRRYSHQRRDNKECQNLERWKNKAGVYFVSNNQVFPHGSTLDLGRSPVHIRREVKIGMAGMSEKMHKRLNQYLLYWPMGVVLYGMILVSSTALKTKKQWLKLSSIVRKSYPSITTKHKLFGWLVRAVEAYAHNYFKHRNQRYRLGSAGQTKKKHGHLSEWFVLKPEEIKTFLESFHANIINNLEDMLSCYKNMSPYIIILLKL